MAQASASIEVPASPNLVWQLIGGFGSLPDWLPYIPESELGEGHVRRLSNSGGETIVERLVKFDDSARSYSYAILQAPFPVTDYLPTLRVVETDSGRGSRVEWSGRFLPDGVSDSEASRLFQGIYEDGLKALTAAFASHESSPPSQTAPLASITPKVASPAQGLVGIKS
ncbi:MAG: SRPBCC family protein [Stellaceae bacterium]